jgi:hypothetical protein
MYDPLRNTYSQSLEEGLSQGQSSLLTLDFPHVILRNKLPKLRIFSIWLICETEIEYD